MSVASPSLEILSLPASLRCVQRWEFPHKLGVCERLFATSLARNGIRWVRTAVGPVWKLDLANPTHRWIVYGCYEGPGLWRWVRSQTVKIATIVDSGANIGQTVLYFASLLPDARIIAYEPGGTARRWLEEGVRRNGFKNVKVEAAGLGHAASMARLGQAGGAIQHGSWNRISASEGEEIAIASLDDELKRCNCPIVDLWKLDVEGYELESLRGAAQAIAVHRIRAIYMETGSSAANSLAYLAEQGYTRWHLLDSGRLEPMRGMVSWGNALLLAPGHPSAHT